MSFKQIVNALPFRLAATLIFFIFVFAILFSRAVSMPVSHDEYQFVAGAQFFSRSLLLPYVSYPFLHMPYMPVIGSAALIFSQDDLLASRLFNSICTLLSAVLLFTLVWRQSRQSGALPRAVFAGTAVLLFISNPALLEVDGRALNHALPILLSIATFWVYAKSSNPQRLSGKFLACGVLIGLATGVRLSYAVLAAPVFLGILFDPCFSSRAERLRSILFLALGLILALLPAGVLFLLAPRPFIYGNFHYAKLNMLYRAALQSNNSEMTIPGKLSMFFQYVTGDPATLLLYLGSLCLFCTAIFRWRKAKTAAAFPLLLLSLYSAVLLIAGFAPTPSWPQYFLAPLPFLILGLYWGLDMLFHQRAAVGLAVNTALCLALLVFNQPVRQVIPDLVQLGQPQSWVPAQMHQLGEQIRAQMNCSTPGCKLLSLLPVLPLEAGVNTYPMFTVGTFSWRTAPILPPETRRVYRIISPDELNDFLAKDPPAAILTGTEANYDGFTREDPGGLDRPFIAYATQNGYRPIPIKGVLNNQPVQYMLWVK
jgi:4-amino-4-deoxy-L-arabinose transferase-like glycosyltransferase